MGSQETLSVHSLQMHLSPAYVKSLQVFYFAMVIGVLIFFFVVLFFYIQSADQLLLAGDNLILMLTVVHLAYAGIAYPVGMIVFNRVIARGSSASGMGQVQAGQILAAIRIASVVRLAIYEGIAFFGLVVLFIATQSGVLQHSPVYWLNLFG